MILTPGFAGTRPYAKIADHLCVEIGRDLLNIIPGRVSTEVDANLSYDTQKTIDKVTHPLAFFVTSPLFGSPCVKLRISMTR